MNAKPDRPEEDEAEKTEQATDAEQEEAAESVADDDPVAALQAKADENWDRYLRAAAELENVRKRAQRDVENAHKFAVERFASELLAVCDSLEAALAAEGELTVASLQEGSEATLKLLGSIMERFGIEEVDPLGEPFDPMQHEAMTMQPSADAEPGSVLNVFQKGYSLNGRLLRPARVVVAAEPAESAEKGGV